MRIAPPPLFLYSHYAITPQHNIFATLRLRHIDAATIAAIRHSAMPQAAATLQPH